MRTMIDPEHIVRFSEVYRRLRFERSEVFGGLPFSITWLKLRYLRRNTIRTLATVTFGESCTLALHPYIFEWSNPILLEGVIHHEMLHLVLGPKVAHSKIFKQIEKDWEHFKDYRRQRQKFIHNLEENARQAGRLLRYECPNCLTSILRTRPMKPESACWKCMKRENNGIWSESYIFIKVGLDEKTRGSTIESRDQDAHS